MSQLSNVQDSIEIGAFTSSGETAREDVAVDVAEVSPTEQPTTWAESVNHEGIMSPGVLPDALSHLYDKGVRFKKVPAFFWSYNGDQPKLSKCCSVYFSVDSICTSQDILEAFDKAGIDIDEIRSIQRRNSNRSWVVSFDSAATKEDALEVSSIQINGQIVFLGDCENRLELVKIYEAPSELPDTTLIGRLSYYGKVLSFRRDKVADCIESRVRTARMRIYRHIPNTINLAGEFLKIWYPSQPKTCRNCGAEDHIAKNCDSMMCFNCERPGHHSRDCEELFLCPVCKGDDHALAVCPFLVYSANVDVPTERKDEESSRKAREERKKRREAAKAARVAGNQSDAPRQNQQQRQPNAHSAQQQPSRPDKPRESTDGRQRRENESQRKESEREDRERRSEREDRERRREDRERSRQPDRRDRNREEERRERDEFEEWKERRRRDYERSDRYYRRDYDRIAHPGGITDRTRMMTTAGRLFRAVNVNINFNYDY